MYIRASRAMCVCRLRECYLISQFKKEACTLHASTYASRLFNIYHLGLLLKCLCIYFFRQQLQELLLKVEEERYQRGGKKRRDLQGETAGERIQPRQAPTSPPEVGCQSEGQAVSPHFHIAHKPQEGANHSIPDGWFIFWLTPLCKCALSAFK